MSTFTDNAPWMMKNLMSDFGFSKLDAAAVIGNAGYESGGFDSLQEIKPVVPGSRGGYGIMQWTGPRRKDFEAYCARNDLKTNDLLANYKFLFVELMGPEGRVISKVKSAKTLDDKTVVFCDTFLRPGAKAYQKRKDWALKALKAYEASPVEPPVVKPDEVNEVTESEKSIITQIIELIWKLARL